MGIAGSILDHSFWESYLGMRVHTVDMTEVRRRMAMGENWRELVPDAVWRFITKNGLESKMK